LGKVFEFVHILQSFNGVGKQNTFQNAGVMFVR
jgi:hypothetical protein